MKIVPNQKTVKVNKEICNKANLYAAINLQAMEQAAIDLKAGAFKLWVYFAKNQNGYEFALSSKDVLESFGIKKDQYDAAIKELIEKKYLVETSKNNYTFNEIAVIGKNHNEKESKNSVVGKTHNDVIGKNHNELQEKTTRNITDTTLYNTIEPTFPKEEKAANRDSQLFWRGVDVEAVAAAKTDRERMKALGF